MSQSVKGAVVALLGLVGGAAGAGHLTVNVNSTSIVVNASTVRVVGARTTPRGVGSSGEGSKDARPRFEGPRERIARAESRELRERIAELRWELTELRERIAKAAAESRSVRR
jgi:hypothetical protein